MVTDRPSDPEWTHRRHGRLTVGGSHLKRHEHPVEPRHAERRVEDDRRERVPDRAADECGQPGAPPREYMLGAFYQRDGEAGFVHSLAPDGGIASAVRDTYAHAFALLGLAWYHRITGDAQVLKIVDETLAFLDRALASDRGGYIDALPRPDALRRQNPHMHLFEAFIALHQATGDARFLARGAEIFGVFSTSFFQPSVGALTESLTEDLDPVPDARGRISEPGHHYEWIWLLRYFQRASGRDVSASAARSTIMRTAMGGTPRVTSATESRRRER